MLIQARDGLWRGPPDLSGPFTPTRLPAPIFVMGATVFEYRPDGSYLVGSFSGMYRVDLATDGAVNLLDREAPAPEGSMRPSDTMITGWLSTPDGETYLTSHARGLLDARGKVADVFPMPPEVREQYRMPLWNYLFEIHNGRFFREWLGGAYILIVPLGSLLFVLVILSGVYDWLRNRFRRWRRRARAIPASAVQQAD